MIFGSIWVINKAMFGENWLGSNLCLTIRPGSHPGPCWFQFKEDTFKILWFLFVYFGDFGVHFILMKPNLAYCDWMYRVPENGSVCHLEAVKMDIEFWGESLRCGYPTTLKVDAYNAPLSTLHFKFVPIQCSNHNKSNINNATLI